MHARKRYNTRFVVNVDRICGPEADVSGISGLGGEPTLSEARLLETVIEEEDEWLSMGTRHFRTREA